MKINYVHISPELNRSVPGCLDQNSVNVHLLHQFFRESETRPGNYWLSRLFRDIFLPFHNKIRTLSPYVKIRLPNPT
jgi:hypothetical protein